MLDSEYTRRDHEFRSNDPYAAGKYRITERWLDRRDDGPLMVHVGCGVGTFNRTAVELGFRVEATEPDSDARAIAAAQAPPGCTIQSLRLEELEHDRDVDVVVMHDVLEHIEDDGAAVAQLHRLLRPNGTLILSVPAMPRLFGLHDEQLGHYRRYTRKSLAAVLSSHFVLERRRAYGVLFVPVTWILSRRLRRPYPVDRVASAGPLSRAVDLICRLEALVPSPIGTSLIVRARARP